jgi:hypothetical protein
MRLGMMSMPMLAVATYNTISRAAKGFEHNGFFDMVEPSIDLVVMMKLFH